MLPPGLVASTAFPQLSSLTTHEEKSPAYLTVSLGSRMVVCVSLMEREGQSQWGWGGDQAEQLEVMVLPIRRLGGELRGGLGPWGGV